MPADRRTTHIVASLVVIAILIAGFYWCCIRHLPREEEITNRLRIGGYDLTVSKDRNTGVLSDPRLRVYLTTKGLLGRKNTEIIVSDAGDSVAAHIVQDSMVQVVVYLDRNITQTRLRVALDSVVIDPRHPPKEPHRLRWP